MQDGRYALAGTGEVGMAVDCANCGQNLQGMYCHACGQKRMDDADRRLAHLLRQGFELATDVDGRLWGSLRNLLFRPGALSRDYLAGRRRRWMSPLGLFLLANVLYFVAPALTDFNLPLRSQLVQPHSSITRPWVIERIAARDLQARQRPALPQSQADPPRRDGYTLEDYGREYDAQAGNVGKALIFVHLPALALGLMLCFRRRRMYFAEHLVVATHQFTFLLLYVQIVVIPAGMLLRFWDHGPPGAAANVALMLPLLAYMSVSLRRIYECSWAMALWVPIFVNALMVATNLFVYRPLQFAVTFLLT